MLIFDPEKFVTTQTLEIKRVLTERKVILACSGGVDSTTCAVLVKRAIKRKLVCVFIDTGFMRLNEPEEIFRLLSKHPLRLPIKIVYAKKRFLRALKGLKDAEGKRKAFRDTFYSILSEVSREEECHVLVQGTIKADIIETTAGVKTQHNVLQQININPEKVYGFKIIEPLASLYKHQVRAVARYLDIPSELSERQPFPGPGLLVRVVGEITAEKLRVEKKVTKIVEEELANVKPTQYFAAVFEKKEVDYRKSNEVMRVLENLLSEKKDVGINIQTLNCRATGVKDGTRIYGRIVLVEIWNTKHSCQELPGWKLEEIQNKVIETDKEVSRVLYRLTDEKKDKGLIVAIRAVKTRDFITASVFDIPWLTLRKTGQKITDSCPEVSSTYYDITSKPPATIEFE